MANQSTHVSLPKLFNTGNVIEWFQHYEALRRKWINVVKCQRSNWDGPSSSSLLCSKHFKEDSFVTEGVQFHEALGVPAQKRLKTDEVCACTCTYKRQG